MARTRFPGRAWRLDAIVLDLMMPVVSGWQFAEAYGALPGGRSDNT